MEEEEEVPLLKESGSNDIETIEEDINTITTIMEDTETLIERNKKGCLKARHVVFFMGFLGFANVYAMRVNLSVAIVAMVNSTKHSSNNSFSNISQCGGEPINTTDTPSHQDPVFNWNEQQQGNILGSFFYGYVLTQLPGGRLAELVGGKWLFGVGILVTAVFTLLTPVAASTSIWLLYAVRVIEGLGEGVTFPAMMAMISRWAPPGERSRMTAFTYAGAQFGTVISMPVSGILCDQVSWQSVFYVFGTIGVIWFVFWCFLAFDSPDRHPRISIEERTYIENSLHEFESKKPTSIPILKILTSVPVMAIAATHITQNFGFYVLLTELPTYMKNVLHFDMKSNALTSGIPYLCMWIVAMSGSTIVDLVIARNIVSTTVARKIANTIATCVPAISLIGAAYSGCNPVLTVVLLVMAVGSNGTIYAGEQSCMVDVANNFAGTLMGIINALGNVMGFVAPQVTGWIINGHNDIDHWRMVFLIAAGAYVVGNTVFVIFGQAKEQKWNRTE